MQGFFAARAGRLSTRPVIAYDSTTISTYSQNQHEARRGFNKDGDGLDTIKLLTLYSAGTRSRLRMRSSRGTCRM